MIFSTIRAITAKRFAIATRVGLGSDANTISNFDMADIGTDSSGDADDFVTDDTWMKRWSLRISVGLLLLFDAWEGKKKPNVLSHFPMYEDLNHISHSA